MATILILYAVCASPLLIWSTSRDDDDLRQKRGRAASKSTINYIAIPSFLLNELVKRHPDLMIFDVCTDGERNARHEDTLGSLTVAKDDLPNLLKWLPPSSTVSFLAAMASTFRCPD